MTEYETAALTAQNWGLWIAVGHIAAALIVGFGQIAVVWYGIRAMQKTGAQRAKEADDRHEETMKQAKDRHEETMKQADNRHEEAMAALKEQGAALRTQSDALRAQGDALRTQGDALRALIERTAPKD